MRRLIEYGYRTPDEIMARLLDDPRTNVLPPFLLNVLAQMIGTMSAQINIAANMLLPLTMHPSRNIEYARDAAQEALALLDYDLAWSNPASATFVFTVPGSATAAGNYTITAADAAARTAPGAGEAPVRFESRSDVVVLQGETEAAALLYAQTTRSPQAIGVTDGTDFQRIDLPETDVVRETLLITVGESPYSRVFTFADTRSDDAHYRLFYRSDGTAYIKFPGVAGDGTRFGAVPLPGLTVTASYAVGGGLEGNGYAAGRISEYAGSDPVVASVANVDVSGNGRLPESIENAREIAPITIRTAGGWTDDSSGLAILKRNFSEILTAQFVRDLVENFVVDVYILEADGSGPGEELADSARQLLESSSDLGQAEVTVRDPEFADIAISGRAALHPGASWSATVKYIELVVALRTSQIASAAHATYADAGLSYAIDQINADFAGLIPFLISGGRYSVTSDGVQIGAFFMSRGDFANVPYQRFGELLSRQDIESAVQGFVRGVDRFVLDLPAADVQPGPGGITRPVSIAITQDQSIVE